MLASISVLISKLTCLKIGSFHLHPDNPQIISETNSLSCTSQIFTSPNFSLFIFLILFFFFLSLKNAKLLIQLLESKPCFWLLDFCPLIPVTNGMIGYHQATVISLA